MYGIWRFLQNVSFALRISQPSVKWRRAAIREYLPRILRQISTLEQTIARYGSQPVVINDIMQWFAFDSMGEFAFNESFGMMKSGKLHGAIAQQRSALALLGPLNAAIWIVRLAFAFAPFFWRVKDWFGMIAFCDSRIKKRLEVGLLYLSIIIDTTDRLCP